MNKALTEEQKTANLEKGLAAGVPTFSKAEAKKLLAEIAMIRVKKKGPATFLAKKFNCTKAEAELMLQVLEGGPVVEDKGNVLANTTEPGVVQMDGYMYNQLTDKYIVPLTTYGQDYVCPGDRHRAMIAAYSNWGGNKESTYEKIAKLNGMRREWVREYCKIMKWTHDTIPVTNEELLQNKGKEAIQRIIDTRKANIQQELQHADWNLTQKDALKWRTFEAGTLAPFEACLRDYKPEPIAPIKYQGVRETNNDVFIVGLSDIHFGGVANAAELFKGSDYNATKIKNIIDEYARKIAAEVASRKTNFKKVAICSLGDILHTLTGETVKGVPLETDVSGESQFDLAFDTLMRFITRMLEIFPEVEVYAVKGNHAGVDDYILFKAIEAFFRTEKRIKFEVSKPQCALHRIGSAAVLLFHGASAEVKAILPASGAPRETAVQRLFLEQPEMLVGTKVKLLLQGDRHSFRYEELPGFENVIMGSCVTGDHYADSKGLYSRSRQNCLVLSDDGVKEVLSFYFD